MILGLIMGLKAKAAWRRPLGPWLRRLISWIRQRHRSGRLW